MYIYYNTKTDYLEVFKKEASNYGHLIDDGVFEMRSTETKEVIGYGIENASQEIKKLNIFDALLKFSIIVKILRLQKGITEEEMAKKLNIALLPYQQIESGKNNPTLETVLKIKKILPELKIDEVA